MHTRTPGHSHTWTPSHLDTCTPRHQYTCTPGHLDTCTPGHLDTWTPGHLHTWTPGHLLTRTPRHLDTWTPGHLDTCTLRHLPDTSCAPIGHLFVTWTTSSTSPGQFLDTFWTLPGRQIPLLAQTTFAPAHFTTFGPDHFWPTHFCHLGQLKLRPILFVTWTNCCSGQCHFGHFFNAKFWWVRGGERERECHWGRFFFRPYFSGHKGAEGGPGLGR